MKTYIGYRSARRPGATPEAIVAVLEPGRPPRPLNPRLDVRGHSPDGFEWGYAGSGPAQLALALAADALGNDARAVAVYQRLKCDLVADLPVEGWTLTEAQLWAALTAIEDERKGAGGEHPGGSCPECG